MLLVWLQTASKVPHATLEEARASPQCSKQGPAALTTLCPTPARQLHRLPACVPTARAALCCRTWGWMQACTLTHALLGLRQRSKCVPSLHTQPRVLRFCTISVIYFNSKSAAPIKGCQVLPEQPVVPFLPLTTLI